MDVLNGLTIGSDICGRIGLWTSISEECKLLQEGLHWMSSEVRTLFVAMKWERASQAILNMKTIGFELRIQ